MIYGLPIMKNYIQLILVFIDKSGWLCSEKELYFENGCDEGSQQNMNVCFGGQWKNMSR